MEKCGFNILLLLPVTGASGAGSHTAISPTQHKAHSRQDRLLTMYPDHLSLVWPPVLPHSLAMASCQLSCGDLCCGGDTNQKAGYHPANTCSHTDSPPSSRNRHWDFCSAEGWHLLCVQFPSAHLRLFLRCCLLHEAHRCLK